MGYPNNLYTPRVMNNLPGISFDPTKDTIFFAEDYNNLANEVVALEYALLFAPLFLDKIICYNNDVVCYQNNVVFH